jgi:indole-3-glycerol phosphate synthase
VSVLDAIVAQRAAAMAAPAGDGLAALAAPGVRLIAEVKRRSPSAGELNAIPDPAELAAAYAGAGAAAISVLTEPHHFGGSLADLGAVAGAVEVPVLRKDFVVEPVQLLEARASGASLVLLIAAVLSEDGLRRLRERAEAMGMHALVEVHDADEARRALASGARIVGVNNRSLKSFEVDLGVCERLRPLLADAEVVVAESGIHTAADLRRLRAAGYGAFLVGSALVRAADPAGAVRALVVEGGA